jgi:hypothetical protein
LCSDLSVHLKISRACCTHLIFVSSLWTQPNSYIPASEYCLVKLLQTLSQHRLKIFYSLPVFMRPFLGRWLLDRFAANYHHLWQQRNECVSWRLVLIGYTVLQLLWQETAVLRNHWVMSAAVWMWDGLTI